MSSITQSVKTRYDRLTPTEKLTLDLVCRGIIEAYAITAVTELSITDVLTNLSKLEADGFIVVFPRHDPVAPVPVTAAALTEDGAEIAKAEHGQSTAPMLNAWGQVVNVDV